MYGAFPAALFCILIFLPPVLRISIWNIVWLVIIQALFYVFLTAYVTPYFALLPELAGSSEERLNLSTWISITYALGIIVAVQVPWLGEMIYTSTPVGEKFRALQIAVGGVVLLALGLMYIPVLAIDEDEYCSGQPSNVALVPALKKIVHNKNFRYYVIADFSYFTGLTIINTGLLYYITVLLLEQEQLVGAVTSLMVIISFFFYPLVNLLAKKVGKKILITVSFFWMGILFTYISFLGQLPLPSHLQAYLLACLQAVPLAFLGVLPNAVLADIAQHNTLKTGEQQEGIFFAARTFMQKLGQTCGVFAALTTLGKNPGNALGVRLSGVAGMILCVAAGIVFTRYKEGKILREIKQLSG